MLGKPSELERIEHMIEAITKIFNYTEKLSYSEFFNQELVQDAVMKNFEVIGEAAYHIPKEFKESYGDIEWKKIEGLRHVLVHDYYKVNPKILWNTKEEYLQDLQLDLEKIVEAITDDKEEEKEEE